MFRKPRTKVKISAIKVLLHWRIGSSIQLTTGLLTLLHSSLYDTLCSGVIAFHANNVEMGGQVCMRATSSLFFLSVHVHW